MRVKFVEEEKRIQRENKEKKFMMFICPTCKTAKDVWHDTKGDTCDEDIYRCLKCNFYFTISAVCDKCGGTHSRVYGCNTKNCGCLEYHYDHKKEKIERKI